MRLAIIIPTLNEERCIGQTLAHLTPLRARGVRVIVADGGSSDRTVSCAWQGADAVVMAARGRANQMNAGARHPLAEDADALLFLHADTQLPEGADRLVICSLSNAANAWGRFDVCLQGSARHAWALRLIAAMINLRSRLTGIATGDQAIFIRRSAFVALQGFASIALMEDVDLSRRAKVLSSPLCLRQQVVTSARRWERMGLWRTMVRMWWLRLAFYFGADPADLARRYGNPR